MSKITVTVEIKKPGDEAPSYANGIEVGQTSIDLPEGLTSAQEALITSAILGMVAKSVNAAAIDQNRGAQRDTKLDGVVDKITEIFGSHGVTRGPGWAAVEIPSSGDKPAELDSRDPGYVPQEDELVATGSPASPA